MAISLDAAAAAFRDAMRDTVRRHSIWYLVQGVLLVVAGVFAIAHPFLSSIAAIILLGWLLIISGVLQAIGLIGAGQVPHFWLQLVSVALALLIGFLFLRDPAQGVVTMTLLLIVFFMIEGMSKIVFALTIRPFPNWGWLLASGGIGVVLSVYLLANVAAASAFLIGILLGIQLIFTGVALTMLAWSVRSA